MTYFKREKPKFGLSLQRGTPDVPDDARYHLLVDGEIVYSTSVLASAEIEYEEVLAARSAPARDILAKERAHFAIESVRSDSFARRAASARKQGGRGGRGGV
ncbi:MAG: hypothetical protein ACRDWY_12800 [Actinomycetes bacterium]